MGSSKSKKSSGVFLNCKKSLITVKARAQQKEDRNDSKSDIKNKGFRKPNKRSQKFNDVGRSKTNMQIRLLDGFCWPTPYQRWIRDYMTHKRHFDSFTRFLMPAPLKLPRRRVRFKPSASIAFYTVS